MKCKIDRLPPALRMFLLRSKCLHRYQEHTEESNSEDHETSDDEASTEESNAEEHDDRTRSRQLFILTWVGVLLSRIAATFRYLYFQMFLEQKTMYQSRQHHRFPVSAKPS